MLVDTKGKFSLFCSSLILFFSCSKPIQHDELFSPYIQKFIATATERNHYIDLKEIDLRINFGALSHKYEGKCKPGKIKQIIINKIFWEKLDTLQRELLIFHELGHCILSRIHKNEIFPTGECKSIMDGKEDGFECSNNYYCPKWRAYYLDELFDSSQKSPDWYKAKASYFDVKKADKVIYNKPLKEVYEENKYGIIALPMLDLSKDLQIDLTSKIDTSSTGGLLINFADFIFSYNKKYKRINITKTNTKGSRNNFYYTNNFQLAPKHNRLTIRKEGSFIYFFVNKQLLHALENHLSNDLIFEELFLKNRIQIRGKGLSKQARLEIFEY